MSLTAAARKNSSWLSMPVSMSFDFHFYTKWRRRGVEMREYRNKKMEEKRSGR
jgi:hypothetical protein